MKKFIFHFSFCCRVFENQFFQGSKNVKEYHAERIATFMKESLSEACEAFEDFIEENAFEEVKLLDVTHQYN